MLVFLEEKKVKGKKFAVAIAAVLAVSMFLLTPVNAVAFPNLPATQVTINLTLGPTKWPGTLALSGVPAGYDVTNSPPSYTAWCAQRLNSINPGQNYLATLVSSLNLPTPWDKINYLLNHNTGEDIDMQVAMWLLLGYTPAQITPDYPGQPSADANAMYTAANTNGAGFIPFPGDLVAVKVVTVGDTQDLIIQLKIPAPPGFTPGFWKHNIQVRLGLTNGKYSAFEGGPLDGVKLTNSLMDSLLAKVHTMPGFTTITYAQALANLQLPGWNPLRTNTANAFNAAAGYGPYED